MIIGSAAAEAAASSAAAAAVATVAAVAASLSAAVSRVIIAAWQVGEVALPHIEASKEEASPDWLITTTGKTTITTTTITSTDYIGHR